MSRVRTTIEIEDTYVQAIMNRYRVRTKQRPLTWRCGIWPASR
jgi:Arc/MetJ family transcription regulator